MIVVGVIEKKNLDYICFYIVCVIKIDNHC